ncbi:MAG: hypothetical protein K0U40_05540 [Betaproteobacteria bacterium]|nr:hypothetical protein [Betaproteobacteria bacterium]
MKKFNNLTSDEVVNEIENLCLTQSSGTIYLTNEKGVMAQILLMEGNIVDIRYQSMRGIEALELIFKSIRFGFLKFAEQNQSVIKSMVDTSLPPTDHILEKLNKYSKNVAKVRVFKEISNDKLARASEIVIAELTVYLGPMAAMVCDEYLENAKDLMSVMGSLDRIANEIGDSAKEIEFKRLVTENIQKL